MDPQTEKEIYQFMGRTANALENIEKRLNSLPCGAQTKEIDNINNRMSKVEGKITIISAVSGFVGSILFAVATWFLGKIKL